MGSILVPRRPKLWKQGIEIENICHPLGAPGIPFLGLCLEMQMAIVFAHVVGYSDAHTAELVTPTSGPSSI